MRQRPQRSTRLDTRLPDTTLVRSPAGARWAGLGGGAEQMPMAAQSVLMGGHVRVGLEDNLYRSRGVLATNEDLVTDAVHLVQSLGARPATAAEADRQSTRLNSSH